MFKFEEISNDVVLDPSDIFQRRENTKIKKMKAKREKKKISVKY